MIKHIQRIARFCRRVNIAKTLYWNFRLFQFKEAITVPLFIGYNVDFIGVHRGSIIIDTSNCKRGTVKIGISDYPQFPTKGVSTMVRLSDGSRIVFGRKVEIGKGCSIVGTYNGDIIFGNEIFVNMYTMFYSNRCIKIGDYTSIGWKCQIYDSNIHYLVNVQNGAIRAASNEIIISNNVWLANHVTLGPGAKIPPFTTVAAHSMVNHDFMMHKDIGALVSLKKC